MAAPKKVAAKLAEGDWVDVLDNEGVWNVAQVLAIKSSSSVCVRYDGWGPSFDEDVDLSTGRIAPYHTYTWTVKCWAKYLNWPWWPCVVSIPIALLEVNGELTNGCNSTQTTVRAPGNETGIAHLRAEQRLYCDFLDTPELDKRFRSWIQKTKVVPYDDHFNERRKHTSGSDFEDALMIMLQSNATTKFPTFVKGTLPKQFKDSPAEHALKTKKSMGELWVRSFASNRKRHADAHAYKYQDGSKIRVRHEVNVKEEKKTVAKSPRQKSSVPDAVGSVSKASPRYTQEMLVVRTDIILDSDEDDEKILRPQAKRVRRISPGTGSKQKEKQPSRVKEIDPTDDDEEDDAQPIPRRISPRTNGKLKEEQPKTEAVAPVDDDDDDNLILRPRVRRLSTKPEPEVKEIVSTTPKGSSAKESAKRTKASPSRSSSANSREISAKTELPELKAQKKRVLALSTGSAELSSSDNRWLEGFKKGVNQDPQETPNEVKNTKAKKAEVPRVSDTDATSADMDVQDFDSVEESDAGSIESIGVADSWDHARNHSFLVLDYERPNVVETDKLQTSTKSKRARSRSSEAEVDFTKALKGIRAKSDDDEPPRKKPTAKNTAKSKSLLEQQISIALGNLDEEKDVLTKKSLPKSSKKGGSAKAKTMTKERKDVHASRATSKDSSKAKSSHSSSAQEPSEITSRASKKPKNASSRAAEALASENQSNTGDGDKPMVFFRPTNKFDDSPPTKQTGPSPLSGSSASARAAQALENEFLRHRFDPKKAGIRPSSSPGIQSLRHIGPSRLTIYASDPRSPQRLMAEAPRLASSSAEFSMNDWFQGRLCAKYLG